MVIIGVENVDEDHSSVIEFFKQWAQKDSGEILVIAPNNTICHKLNKKMSLREYCKCLTKNKQVGILIIEITKEGLEKNIYKQIVFDMVVFLNGSKNKQKTIGKGNRIAKNKLKLIKAKYIIVPESWGLNQQGYITYGWSQAANISISSAEKNVNGGLSVQCSLETCIPSLKKTILLPGEFSIETTDKNIEYLMAGVAMTIVYGHDLGIKRSIGF